MPGRISDDKLRCSFCNKTQDQVRKLIAGPNGTYICDECVSVCDEILNEEFDDYEEFYLPVCNSPRMGVCGYEGSDRYPDSFEPDKK